MEFRPLHPDFGAEVIGFDTLKGGTPEDVAQLRDAYDRYSILLFRGGEKLSHERHAEITSWFGPPAPVSNSNDGNYVSVLHNKERAGSQKLPFHCDLTYTDVPIKAICLQAIEVPERPTSTLYASNFNAWDRLSPAMQARLEGLTLRHFHNSNMPEYNWPDFVADHPLRFPHPRTGRPLLMVTEHHAGRILEVDEAQSRALIDELLAGLYTPERQYDHVWQLNDLLLWDNLAVQHARPETYEPAGGNRALQRVALSEVGMPELIERARARQAA